MTTGLAGSTDDAALLDFVGCSVVPQGLGRRFRIVAFDRKPSPATTSYASEILSVTLAGGERFRIFLKDFGHSRLPKDAFGERRERELRVYRHLIGQGDMGTARYYGAVWNERRRRYWLLLELVDGVELRSCEVEHWPQAAGWLGRMQGHFARFGGLDGSYGFLQRHDADFFRSRGRRAMDSAARFSTELARRLRKVIDRYERLIDVMASQPRTLVHGAYRPANILVDMRRSPPRICPVDWELAAIGSPLYDLAFFCDGFEPPVLDRIWSAYCDEATKAGVSLPEPDEMRYVVDCFRLFRVMAWLAPALDKRYSKEEVEKLVSRGESLLALFEG
jgi:thiamine kinase-like enzyme